MHGMLPPGLSAVWVLLVVEVSTISFMAESVRGIACLAASEVRAVRCGKAPEAAAAAILHEVRLAQYKSHFILVSSTQVW